MVNVSFDPEAGTLYWYFTEIEEGSTELEGECEGTLLLDANGDVIGLDQELDGVSSSEDILHMSQIYERGEVLGYVILGVGLYRNHGIGIVSRQSQQQRQS